MPYQWKFYGLNKSILIDKHVVLELEETLDVAIQIAIRDVTYSKIEEGTDSKLVRRTVLKGGSFEVMFVCDTELKIPMVMCCWFNTESQSQKFIECLKEETGAIIWPIYFDNEKITAIIDSVVEPDHWYDTKLLITLAKNDVTDDEVEDEVDDGKMLRKFSIEFSRFDCENLYRNSVAESVTPMNPYRDYIFPYLYEETGIIYDKLPIRYVMLQALMTVREDNITTIRCGMSNNILIACLNFIQ